DEKDGDPVVLALRLRVRHHRRAEEVRLVRPGAPGLLAGDEVLVALPHRPALDPRGIAASVRLGERGRREQLSGAQPGEELLLLLLGAVCLHQRGGDDHSRHHRADGEPGLGQLLGHDGHRERIETAAPVVRGEDEAEVAELRHLLHDLRRDLRRLVVELVRDRRHFAVGEVAHALADLDVLLGERAAARVGDGHRYRPPWEERFLTRILRSYTHTSSPRWFLPVVRTWTMPRSGLLPLSRLSSTSLDEISVS